MRKRRFSMAGIFLAATLTVGAVMPLNSFAAAEQQAYNWKNVNIGGGGGFIPGIEFSKVEKDLIYTRTDMGGIYRWDPKTSSWTPLTDSFNMDEYSYYGIDSIAADPVDANKVYAAAGMYTNSWLPNTGVILRSSDKGNTWQKSELPFKFGGNMPGRSMGERLSIDPNSNNIIYLGTRCGNGLWKSTDSGVTWTQVKSFPNPGTYIQDPTNDYSKDIIGVVWVAFDTKSSAKGQATKDIYVGVADKNKSIYRSTDGGETWEAVPGQPTGYLPHHGVLSANGSLYITYSDSCGPYEGKKGDVWKYDTVSKKWTQISPIPSLKSDGSSNGDNFFGYAGLTVDAQHPDTIMVTSMESWWPDTMIWRSLDGGATWTRIWDWGSYPERTFKYTQDISAAPWLYWGGNKQLPEVSPKLGWMVGDFEIDPFNSDRMLYGTGATLYGSDNLTAWDKGEKVKISVKATGIEEEAVQDLISPPEGAHLLSAIGDVVGFRHDDLDKIRDKIMVPDYNAATSIDYAEKKPNFMAIVGSTQDTSGSVKCISFTNDGGSSWVKGNSGPSGNNLSGHVAVSADGKAVLWAPKDAIGGVTTNNGSSWTIYNGLPVNADIASDRVNGQKFYGFLKGTFYVSADAGKTFTASKATGLPTAEKVDIKAIPGKEGDIWLTGREDGLWHSTDGGTTFTKLSNVDTAYVVGFGKAAEGKDYSALYITGKIDGVMGFFRSDDAGATWIRINDEKHGYGAVDTAITGDPRVYGRVYIGTNGRGIVYGDIAGGIIPSEKSIVGDVNGDKVVNALDFAAMKSALLGKNVDFPVEDDLWASDVNNDGTFNALDFALMKTYLLGKITEFPKK